jgi:hypothetical protein
MAQNSDIGIAASNPYSYSPDLCELCDLLFKMLFFAALVFKSAFPAPLESHTKPTKMDFEQRDRGEHKDTEKAEEDLNRR